MFFFYFPILSPAGGLFLGRVEPLGNFGIGIGSYGTFGYLGLKFVRRCRLNSIFFLALVAIIFAERKTLGNLVEGHRKNIFVK